MASKSAAASTERIDTALAGEHMAFADAALRLAGHELTGSAVRGLMTRVARAELTGDEAVAALRRTLCS